MDNHSELNWRLADQPARARILDLWMGGLVVTPFCEYGAGDVEGAFIVDSEDRELAAITWRREGPVAEIVTLDALVGGRGYGREALGRAETYLRSGGVEEIFLFTTNDNTDAQALYLKSGYRLVALHLDSMDRVRRRKPAVPLTGMHGIPLRDMWEFRKRLG